MITSRADLKIVVVAGECNGFMNSVWSINDNIVKTFAPLNPGPHCLEFEIQLPCVIKIVFSGKNSLTDTQVNSQGQILQDKFIKIEKMWLARHSIPDNIFMKIINFTTDSGEIYQNNDYFGFNGQALLTFAEKDAVIWHMRHNHYRVS
jgi:hypothetical protein